MKVKYLAHSAFLITSDSGTRIITDPYQPGSYGGSVGYAAITEPADVVTVSHEHGDHNYPQGVPGNPTIVKGPGEHKAKGISIKGVAAHHDDTGGSQRGSSDMMCFNVDGMNVCHVGDLGHMLSSEQLSQMGQVDVLFLPVGGVFTVDAVGATDVVDQVRPRVVIPMHYKVPKNGFDVAGVDDFLAGKANVVRVEGSEVKLERDTLPKETQIIVLQPELGQ
ncbi:MAG: MBL fold metallo-hydrolase [Chloroflexota bacterium]|nr:MAG: MBL fold metallo-hydrolase [Chloroflexota bacterium]